MWECHYRLDEFVDEESCRDIIQSFEKEKQKHPVLARRREVRGGVEYDLIYGARRLFAARYLNIALLASIVEIDDRSAFVEMNIENLRRSLSPYETGIAFSAWLRSGHFKSQDDLATTLGLSSARVCRLMKFSRLPAVIVKAFSDPREMREAWAVKLAKLCADSDVKTRMVAVARALAKKGGIDAARTFKLLLDGRASINGASERANSRDELIRADDGTLLFRISYRYNELHVIISRDSASPIVVSQINRALKKVLEAPANASHAA
jgi:ParB family chromosome partitioning protein